MSQFQESCARQLEPDRLADLALSPMGLGAHTPMIRELCWAVHAHCAARGVFGRWDRVEVETLLDAWTHGYPRAERVHMLWGWVAIVAWMRDLGLLDDEIANEYLMQTRGWACEELRVARSYLQIIRRIDCENSSGA